MTESKTIVITGASDGIGAAAAVQLYEQGHRVVVVGRSPEKTGRIADRLGVPYYLADFAELDKTLQALTVPRALQVGDRGEHAAGAIKITLD